MRKRVAHTHEYAAKWPAVTKFRQACETRPRVILDKTLHNASPANLLTPQLHVLHNAYRSFAGEERAEVGAIFILSRHYAILWRTPCVTAIPGHGISCVTARARRPLASLANHSCDVFFSPPPFGRLRCAISLLFFIVLLAPSSNATVLLSYNVSFTMGCNL